MPEFEVAVWAKSGQICPNLYRDVSLLFGVLISVYWVHLLTGVAYASQTVLGGPRLSVHDEGLFTPMEDMNALSVKSYTGYIDIEARHIFFYFFESRSDPDTDDVIFWTNGGALVMKEQSADSRLV
ncbi:hypothetical protein GGX14DRAFT_557934 [Mycena pura]|uniref:Uncharacterized protein n=1 Tax=Mycena pura TaxID=153505 RepID=A0AAD6YM23_9AGAR|nr:hypothetical protein GGX14DRAFT_557934 [Mycena pura]